MRIAGWWADLLEDLRYALRGLSRRPRYTGLIVATLGLGIGGTTCIFAAIYSLTMRPLPFVEPGQLMRVSLMAESDDRRPSREIAWSYARYRVFREHQQLFESHALYSGTTLNLRGEHPERLNAENVGATYFTLLGVPMVLGPGFSPALDDRGDQDPQVVLAHDLWRRMFATDSAVIGATMDLEGRSYAIVGVAAEGFLGFRGNTELFVPITARPASDLADPDASNYNLVARRKSAIPEESVRASIGAIARGVGTIHPVRGASLSATVQPLDDLRVTPAVRVSLKVLLAAAVLVLTIACVNIANLMLGRAVTRRREIAVRLAMGAERGRLVRFLLSESLVLAVLGGLTGVVVAWWGARALASIDAASALRIQGIGALGVVNLSQVRLDVASLAFAFGVTLVVTIACGLAPALRETKNSLAASLKETVTASRGTSALQRLLVITEVAVAIVLLTGSGLMLRSLERLLAVDDAGFSATRVLTMQLRLAGSGHARDSLPDVYRQLEERIRAIPGVEDVGLRDCAPLSRGCLGGALRFPERGGASTDEPRPVDTFRASVKWFATMRVPVRTGRLFNDSDHDGAPRVAVISEAAARAYWPGENPIGTRVTVTAQNFGEVEVIGVVADVREWADSAAKPAVYLSYAQSPQNRLMLFVRGSVDPEALTPAVQLAVTEILPGIPVFDVQPMEARVRAATAPNRLNATLLGLFAASALALSALGIYGVLAFSVSQRTREIGIRMALGATRARVLSLVVREGLLVAIVGVGIGIGGALAVTRVLQGYLYEVDPMDPITFVGTIAVLLLAAAMASWVPARRASGIDPMVALRSD